MRKTVNSVIKHSWHFECLNHSGDYEPHYSEYFDDLDVAVAWGKAHDMRYHGVR